MLPTISGVSLGIAFTFIFPVAFFEGMAFVFKGDVKISEISLRALTLGLPFLIIGFASLLATFKQN